MPGLALLGILIGGAVLIVMFVVGIYNRLVQLRNRVKNAFAQIDVQLKRRYDLIPNLVETAKGYMKHEKETLEAVVNARAKAVSGLQVVANDPADAAKMAEFMKAEGALTGALGKLLAVAEAYPDLKANENMMQLSEELTSTENKVAFSRQAYNDAVLTYNNAVETVPNNFVAGWFRFEKSAFFEVEAEAERAAPKVEF